MSETYDKAIKDYLKPIVGGKIMRVGVTASDDVAPDGYPFLIIKASDGKMFVVTFLTDPEGNGAGHPNCYLYETGA